MAYIVHALFIGVIGALCFFWNAIIASLILIMAVLLVLIRTGILIDTETKMIKTYNNLFYVYFGTWMSIEWCKSIELRMTNESQLMNSRGTSNTVQTKTYDLIFKGENGKETEFYDFTDYSLAVRAMKSISETFNINSINKVEQIKHSIKRR